MKKQVIHKLLLFLFVFITVAFTNSAKTLATMLPSRMCVDTPKLNQVIDNKSFDVSGWALNASGIKEVKVYVDDSVRGTATYGLDRPDVAAVFQGYTNGNKSGFTYHVDINTISAGTHKISVYANGNDGTSQHIDLSISITKKVPRMCVDTPNNNAYISNTSFNIGGWSLNPSGVNAVRIYIDGNFISNAKYGLLRNDVNAAFPGYPGGSTSGFSYNLDVTNISPGSHKLSIMSIGNDGSNQTIDRMVNITKKSPVMSIDYPINNFSTTERDLKVSGWTLNASGIKTIQYYLNNQLVGTSTDGIQRPDVNAVFPGYVNGNTSGFSFSFNVMKYISPGTQNATLKVVSIGNDGTSCTMIRNLVLKKLPERIYIDTPINNNTIKNNIYISGWALNASGISSVKVYLDGVFNGSAAYGSDRPDVNSAYSGYTDGSKSGFKYTLDTSKLSVGRHTIRVDSIGIDGKVASQSISINFYGIVNYESYSYTLDYMTNVQLQLKEGWPVYYNRTTGTWDPADYNMIRQNVDSSSIANDLSTRYEFLKLNYNDGVSVTDLNNILNNKGVLTNTGEVFLNSAKANNVNPIYLVSHALIETGNGISNLSKGILVSSVDGVAVTPKVVYNFFGTGAIDTNPDKYGSEYAYKHGWDTVDKAIMGGIGFISEEYINSSTNQDTLYKMRWNPANPGTHQYATDIRWAYSQVAYIKELIDQCTNSILHFNIPTFQ